MVRAVAAARNKGLGRASRVSSRLLRASSEDDEADEDAPEDSGDNETVCHRCAAPGVLLCCDGEGCTHAWHRSCLPADAMPPESDPWLCPVCAGSSAHVGFVGNPQAAPHRGSRQRSRKRHATEGTKPQVAAAEKARQQSRDFR
jgi:hypothetical protein